MTMWDGTNNTSTEFATLNSTDYTVPSPQACSSSDEWSSYPSWRAFNQEYNYGWMSATVGLTVVSIMVDLGFGNEKLINKYAIPEKSPSNNSTFKDWILQGSNTVGCAAEDAKNANGWTDLDTRETGTIGTIDVPAYLTFICDMAYRYFRIRITDTVGGIGTYRPACQGVRLVAQDLVADLSVVIVPGPAMITLLPTVDSAMSVFLIIPPAGQIVLLGKINNSPRSIRVALLDVQNYLSVSVPSLNQAEDIAERLNGDLLLYQILSIDGEVMQEEEIARAALERIEVYEGGRNQSIVLSGYKTVVKSPKLVFLRGVTYRKLSNAAIATVRTAIPDLYLEPGDLANDGETDFEVSAITIAVGSAYSQMDIEG